MIRVVFRKVKISNEKDKIRVFLKFDWFFGNTHFAVFRYPVTQKLKKHLKKTETYHICITVSVFDGTFLKIGTLYYPHGWLWKKILRKTNYLHFLSSSAESKIISYSNCDKR